MEVLFSLLGPTETETTHAIELVAKTLLDASRWDDLTRQQSALTKAHSQRLAALQLGAKAESPGYQEKRMGELGVGA